MAGKIGVVPTLSTAGNQGHGCTGGWVLGINANSQHKDEAWKFIDFLLSKDTQTSLSLNSGLISSRPDVANDPAVQSKLPQIKQLATILQSGNNRPQLKNYNQFTTPLQAAINGVPEMAIMKQTRHRSSEMLRRYVRDASLFRENASSRVGL